MKKNTNPFAGNSHFGDGLEVPAKKQPKKQPKTITKLTPAMVKFITNWENTMDEPRG